MGLKELTKEVHQQAERQDFVKILMSGSIDRDLYATFLYNQHALYNLLEVCAMSHGLLNEFKEIRRAPHILADFQELWSKEEMPQLTQSTENYLRHMMTIKDDPNKLMAHIYVRHMGDLSGGQMIKKKVPGKGSMYEFEGDVKSIKETIRSKTDDSMADEARLCFQYATDLFKELYEIHNAQEKKI